MTKPITDASTGVAEAIANKFVFGDGYTGGIYACIAYRIHYDGANWVVATTHGSTASDHHVTAAWVGADNRLDVDISSLTNQFTGIPVPDVSPLAASAHASQPRYDVQANATAVNTIQVRFVDLTAPTNYATAESTKMAFNLMLYGLIG